MVHTDERREWDGRREAATMIALIRCDDPIVKLRAIRAWRDVVASAAALEVSRDGGKRDRLEGAGAAS